MDQQTTGLSLDQVLGNPTSPSGSAQATPNPDMLAEANSHLSSGMDPDDAIRAAYEKYPEANGVSFSLSKDGKSFTDNGVQTKGLDLSQVTGGQPQDRGISLSQAKGEEEHNTETPHTNVSNTLQKTLKWFNEFGENKREDTLQALGNVGAYFHNYTQEHELTDGGPITTQQKAAAKLLGMDLPNFPIWGPVYKMSPTDREALDKKYQESIGLHPDQTMARLSKTTDPNAKGGFDPYGNFLNDSMVTHLASQAFSPELATTKKYQAIQDMMENMDAVDHPEKYNPKFVKYSADKILAYKKMNETGTIQKIKDYAGDIKKNPVGAVKGFAGGALSDPELLLAPEAKLGSFAVAGRDATALGTVGTAAKLRGLADAVRGAAANAPHIQEAAATAAKNYAEIGGEAAASAKRLQALKHVGNIVGTTGAGAGINAATEAASQEANQGYVKKGSLTLAEVTGAAFGGGVHLLGEIGAALRGNKVDLKTDLKDRVQDKGTHPSDDLPTGANANNKPGQPLSPDTPISHDGTVPYTGSIDANMDGIHIHKGFPESLPMENRKGKTVNIPVLQTVGYHEAVEGPLIHVTGPVDDETIADLEERIGPDHTLPPKTIEKLKRGESLVYTNPDHEDTDPGGHEIATWAENHMVSTLYDMDPEIYQNNLKPHIKEVAKDSQKPGEHANIPDTMDTKPYDDVGQSDQLKGQGDRPTVDNVEPGAEENTDNQAQKIASPRPIPSVDTTLPIDSPELKGTLVDRLNRRIGFLGKEFINGKLYSKLEVISPTGKKVYGIGPSLGDKLLDLTNKQSGKIDPRLLATGAVAGGGALAGTLMPGDKEKNALLGGIAGLATSALFWGGDVGVRGKALKEGGMFVGPTARTWKGTDAQMAERMERIGKSPDEITLATGLHRNTAGQWTGEISDKDMKLVPPDHPNWVRAKKEAIPLSAVMDHDKLDKSYPGLLDQIKIRINSELKSLGSFNPNTDTITLREAPKEEEYGWEKVGPGKNQTPESIIAHEIQHVIQSIEGFPTGSSSRLQLDKLKTVQKYLEGRFDVIFNKIVEAERRGASKGELDKLEEQYNKIQDQLTSNYTQAGMEYGAFADYSRQAGEVQARNTQERLDMSEEERRQTTPRQTQDTQSKSQLIRMPKGQQGNVDPEMLGRIARAAILGTVGATIGMRLSPDDDDKWRGALTGAGLAVLSGPLLTQFLMHPVESVKRISTNLKETATAPPKENISDATSRWQEAGLHQEIAIYRIQKAIQRIAPTKASRIRITHALDTGDTKGLSPKELAAYKIARQFDDYLGQLGQKAGVLPQLINNHISHIWKNDEKLKAYKDMVNSQVIANMSPKTAFATARQLRSIAQGKAMGLTPVTEDVSEILGIYAKSVMNAIRNKQLIEGLKNTKDSTGQSYLITPARKAPFNYVPINHPQLRGMSAHPTIAPELRNVFYTYDMGPVQGALSTLNMALKRSEVSFSAFHLTSELDAYLGGMPTFTQPIKTVGRFVGGVVGKSSWHDFLQGKADPDITALGNRFIASGAVPQIPKGMGRDIDLSGNDYYEGLKQMQEYLDKAMPGLGKIPDIAGKVSHVMDHVIFENAMSSAKFSLWMHAVQKMNEAWAKEARVNPSVKVPEQTAIDKMAGGYVNNLLGAQNWLQAANEASTRLGRYYLNALGSPVGRKIASYLLFAPDWTTSTVMSFTKTFGKGSEQFGTGTLGKISRGIQGLHNPKTVADLHRIYQFRSAMLYALIGGVINYAYSGHYIWDNKDPTTIDLGNGQRMQWNKHWTEPYDIARRPAQAIVNKMGVFPKEILDQLTHKEYINTSGYSPDMKDRLAHVVKNVVPIPFQNLGQETPQQLMWNLAGRNVIGQPTQDKAWQSQEHAKRSASAKAAAEKRAAERLKKLYGG
jgi:hypothetical protein